MDIQVNLKHIAKRRQSVVPKTYTIVGTPATVRELILAVTDAGVEEYNKNMERSELLTCLTKEEIDDQAQAGKVSFGVNYGEKHGDIEKARENAIQCFEDGIYRVFLDDSCLESLDQLIEIKKESIFTFVRLTMLTGRMW
ncbi:MAG: hypothetical protein HFG65_05705 [Hungatella sp.]|nr:hypothetical protein [Hungatella sp.]